jgi:hypothetical protein
MPVRKWTLDRHAIGSHKWQRFNPRNLVNLIPMEFLEQKICGSNPIPAPFTLQFKLGALELTEEFFTSLLPINLAPVR